MQETQIQSGGKVGYSNVNDSSIKKNLNYKLESLKSRTVYVESSDTKDESISEEFEFEQS